MFQQKRMFKVISPIDLKDGAGKYWMRVGRAFVNKDNSINVHLDAVPFNQKDGLMVQLREYTDEELRERAEKRATYAARGTLGQSAFGDPNIYPSPSASPSHTASSAQDGVPF